MRLKKVGTIALAETAVDAQQNHRLQLDRRGIDDAADFVSVEVLLAMRRFRLSLGLLIRFCELRTELHDVLNEIIAHTALEEHARHPDVFCQPIDAVNLRKRGPQIGKVERADIRNRAVLSDFVCNGLADHHVVSEGVCGEFSGVHTSPRGGQKRIRQNLDGQFAIGLLTRCPAPEQVVFLVEPFLQCGVGMFPLSEVV